MTMVDDTISQLSTYNFLVNAALIHTFPSLNSKHKALWSDKPIIDNITTSHYEGRLLDFISLLIMFQST